MKHAARFSALLLLSLSAPHSSAAVCLIGGTVLDEVSGKPVPKTRVYAKPTDDFARPAILRTTGEQGAFCFERLDPGRYEVAFDRSGYLHALYGAKVGGEQGLPLNVDGHTELPPLTLKMLPVAAIAGVVLDANGEPREQAYVELDRKGWDKGWSPDEVTSAYTDDRGAFRFALLAPGTYYVSVAPASVEGRQFLDNKGHPIRTAEALTYYNGSQTFARATPIPLQPGQEIANLVITMESVTPRRFSGRLGSSVSAEDPIKIQLSSQNGVPPMRFNVARDGTFSADGLLPGKYRMYLTGGAVQYPEFPDVDLTNGDLEGLVAEPEQTFDIHVSARVEGAASSIPAQLRVTHLERGFERVSRSETAGSYLFRVIPGTYRLYARPADHVFVKTLVINGQPKTDPVLDLRKGQPGTVEAILSPNVAVVDGRLDRPEGALPSLATTVVMMDETTSRTEVVGDQVNVDHTGKFKVDSLAPGKYRVYAIEGFEENVWGSLELAAALREKSLALELHEGETRSLVLPVITPGEWTAALRKVGM